MNNPFIQAMTKLEVLVLWPCRGARFEQNQSLDFHRTKPLVIEKEHRQGRATAHSGHQVPDKPFPHCLLASRHLRLLPSCIVLAFLSLTLISVCHLWYHCLCPLGVLPATLDQIINTLDLSGKRKYLKGEHHCLHRSISPLSSEDEYSTDPKPRKPVRQRLCERQAPSWPPTFTRTTQKPAKQLRSF